MQRGSILGNSVPPVAFGTAFATHHDLLQCILVSLLLATGIARCDRSGGEWGGLVAA